MFYSTALGVLVAAILLTEVRSSALPPEAGPEDAFGLQELLRSSPSLSNQAATDKFLAKLRSALSNHTESTTRQHQQSAEFLNSSGAFLERQSATLEKQREQNNEFMNKFGSNLDRQMATLNRHREQSNQLARNIDAALEWRSGFVDKGSDQFRDFLEEMDVTLEAQSKAMDNQIDQFKKDMKEISEALDTQSAAIANQSRKFKEFVTKVGETSVKKTTTMTRQSNEFNDLLLKMEETTGRRLRDCSELKKLGKTTSGVFYVRPDGFTRGFEVYCDLTTDGGGWTVFQRRGQFGNPQDYFSKTWNEYKQGFGDLLKEFWMGNDRLNALTSRSNKPYELRVDMAALDKSSAYAKYRVFQVEDERQAYKVTFGTYSGTAGDAVAEASGKNFVTKDRDNSNYATAYGGGWWYVSSPYANPNGRNFNAATSSDNTGICWNQWKGTKYSMPSIELKMRPRQ